VIPWLKILPYAAIAIGGAILLAFVHHNGVIDGRAQIQAKFDKFVDAQEALTIKAQKEADAQETAAKIANAKILSDYQHQISTSHDYAALLASRLRDALSHTGGSPVPEGEGGQPPAGAGPSPSATGIGERIADALAECRDNANQLDALLFELTPQL
jgi:hypothetical protein